VPFLFARSWEKEERAKKAAEMAEARRLRKEQEAQQQAAAEEARQAGQQEQATGDKVRTDAF
jgi:hypothetical protein